MGFLEQFNPFSRSGIWMFLILMVSVYIVTIVVERAYALWFRFKIDASQILSRIISFVDSNNYSRAIEVCNSRQNHPMCMVLKSGLLKANRSDVEIRRAIEQATMKVAPQIQKRTPYLATLANVATLLGLLGTIFGLIMAFEGVEMASAAKKQEVLARGISLAMNTTAFGLIVAIPTTIAHAVLSARQNSLLDTIEDSAMTLFNHLSAKNRMGTMKR
ncbi:MAG: MotA/TolQ/ExbB proton channel family protein [Deltaproteobacteria bacterium]|nr:MAG: MotA/TolQ/ExbB proton channel family protein [Deltaproteobacteria bacterium]